MPVAVFDTNVVLSAIGWGGKPGQCLEAARRGDVQGATCQELLEELEDKLKKLFGFSPDEVFDQLADLLQFLTLVRITGNLNGVTADRADDKVLECAVTARAEYLVTGDRRHLLPLRIYEGVKIVTPNDFLQIIARQ
jgi:uncharacterized protein